MNPRDLVPLTDSEIQESYARLYAAKGKRSRGTEAMPSPLDERSLRSIQTYAGATIAVFGVILLAGLTRMFSYWGEASWAGGIMTLLALGYRFSPELRSRQPFDAEDPSILLPVVEAKRSEIESKVVTLRESLIREKRAAAERVHQMETRRQTVTHADAEWNENLAQHLEGYSLEEKRLRRVLEETETDLADLEQESVAVLRALDLARSLMKYPDAEAFLADAAHVDEEVEGHISEREVEVAELRDRMEAVRGQMSSLAERLAVGMRG